MRWDGVGGEKRWWGWLGIESGWGENFVFEVGLLGYYKGINIKMG